MPSSYICPLRIMCTISMPDRMTRLTARWFCSTMLFRYLLYRILIGVSRSVLSASRAARLAPLLPTAIVSGSPF